MGLYSSPFSRHLAMPKLNCLLGLSVHHTSPVAFSPKDQRKEWCGFWKAELLTVSCVYCVLLPAADTTGAAPVIDLVGSGETVTPNFKHSVIKIAEQLGRRGADQSHSWEQAQTHTIWVWKNRWGFESGVLEARHAFIAVEKLAAS